MTTFPIKLNGQDYSLVTTDPAQLAAIAACCATYNKVLPQTVDDAPNPALLADDAAYLQYVFGHWAAANVGFTDGDLQTAAASAFASYAGQNPPEKLVEQPLKGDALKNALKAYAAAKRFNLETGGVIFNGMSIATDRATQNKLAQAVLSFQAGALSGTIDWKGPTGWIAVDQTTITAIASAVAAHVQKAFSTERAISEAIDADAIATAAEIDAYAWG